MKLEILGIFGVEVWGFCNRMFEANGTDHRRSVEFGNLSIAIKMKFI